MSDYNAEDTEIVILELCGRNRNAAKEITFTV